MADSIRADLLVDCRNTLAEGIQWNVQRQRLYWTDILGRALWSCDEQGGETRTVTFEKRIGCFAFTEDERLLIAFEDGLAFYEPVSGGLHWIADIEPEQPTTRLNDGRCDRSGRFVFGGVDESGLRPLSAVYRYDGERVEKLFGDVGCANGIAFSPEGARLYFADTSGKTIEMFDYGGPDAADRTPFVTLTDEEGRPDGSCVDSQGNLWNAQFNGARVQQFHPDGSRGIRVDLPVSQVTCACFGGADLDKLFITTARENFTPEQAAAEPTAGGIYRADVGIEGLPEQQFTGRDRT